MLWPAAAWAVIQSRISCSQGQRSSSCSGNALGHLADVGLRVELVGLGQAQPRCWERAAAMVDLPAPATPMTTRCVAGNCIVLPPKKTSLA